MDEPNNCFQPDIPESFKMSIVDMNKIPASDSCYLSKITQPNKEPPKPSKSVPSQSPSVPQNSNANPFNTTGIRYSTIQNYIVAKDFLSQSSINNPYIYEATISQYENKSLISSLIHSSKNKKTKQGNEMNFSKGTIDKIKSTGQMVENTYYNHSKKKEQLEQETCFLNKVINGWRRVSGDGNCFYRSAIYAWLEYLVFNSRVDILKCVICDLGMNMNKNIHPALKDKYSQPPSISITILNYIVEQLTDKNETVSHKKIQNAYTTLFEAFQLQDKSFDIQMIMYLRYLLYKFINDNKCKCFSEDFPVLLGNLLPNQFEVNEEEFLFDDYFVNDLLKLYTCAEKIAVYITPYVLNINLNIVMYDYGDSTDIQTKLFKCPLKGKDMITILFRTGHYDVCYTNEYRKKYEGFLNMFSIKKEGGYFLMDERDINKMEQKMELLGVMPKGSKVYNYNKTKEEIEQKEAQLTQDLGSKSLYNQVVDQIIGIEEKEKEKEKVYENPVTNSIWVEM